MTTLPVSNISGVSYGCPDLAGRGDSPSVLIYIRGPRPRPNANKSSSGDIFISHNLAHPCPYKSCPRILLCNSSERSNRPSIPRTTCTVHFLRRVSSCLPHPLKCHIQLPVSRHAIFSSYSSTTPIHPHLGAVMCDKA